MRKWDRKGLHDLMRSVKAGITDGGREAGGKHGRWKQTMLPVRARNSDGLSCRILDNSVPVHRETFYGSHLPHFSTMYFPSLQGNHNHQSSPFSCISYQVQFSYVHFPLLLTFQTLSQDPVLQGSVSHTSVSLIVKSSGTM